MQAEQCRRSLARFIRDSWHVIRPRIDYVHNWHIDLVAEYLAAVTYGQIKRLLINEPPRYMKSLETSVMWPAWEWIEHPEFGYLFSSYAASLSLDHARDRRELIKSKWYTERWPTIKIRADQDQLSSFGNTLGGEMNTRGTAGIGTGRGGNRVIIDDPHNTKQAESDKQRTAAIDDYDRNLTTRLNNPDTDAIVIVMQRLHERDLAGHVMFSGEFEVLKLPALCEVPTTVVFPLSGEKITRKPGDALWQERHSAKTLKQGKDKRPFTFAAQYQQEPSPPEGGLIKRAWWRYYGGPSNKSLPDAEMFDQTIQSWDMAFKDSKEHSYVVGTAWGRIGADVYLLDLNRKHRDFPSTCKAVIDFTERLERNHWPCKAKLVEDKANGPAVIQTLRKKVPGLIAIEPYGGVDAIAAGVSPMIESGNVYLPHESIAPWVVEFVDEWAKFPNSEFTDQVASGAQALKYLFKYVSTRSKLDEVLIVGERAAVSELREHSLWD